MKQALLNAVPSYTLDEVAAHYVKKLRGLPYSHDPDAAARCLASLLRDIVDGVRRGGEMR